jgi:chorismate mutase
MPVPPIRLLALRGATTLPEDTAEAMDIEVRRLLEALVSQNHVQPEDIVSVFFSLTPDLHSISPAKVARRALPWEHVALFSAVEPDIHGQPAKAVRVLIQFYSTKTPKDVKHVYLNEARHLRPDRH